jgi:hypothetical protein
VTLTEVIMGLVRGLTEPLPVSSSAHLVIIPALIPGFHQPSVLFDVVLQLGTLIAVIFPLRKDIAGIVASLPPETEFLSVRPAATGEERTTNRKLAFLIQIPTGDLIAKGPVFYRPPERDFLCFYTPLCTNKPDWSWPLCPLLPVCRHRHTDRPGHFSLKG